MANQWYERAALQGHGLAKQRICRLTPECYSKSPRLATDVFKRIEKDKAAKRARISELLGTVVVKAQPFEGDVDINRTFSRYTRYAGEVTLKLAQTSVWAVEILYRGLALAWTGTMTVAPLVALADPLSWAFLVLPESRCVTWRPPAVLGEKLPPFPLSSPMDLSTEQNKVAKNLRKQLHASFDDAQPEKTLQQAIVKAGMSRFDNAFVLESMSVSDSNHKPDTIVTIKDVKIDVHPIKPFDPEPHTIASHEYSLKIAALVEVFSINRKTTLIDTDWYEYKKRNLTLPNLASADKRTLEEAIEVVSQNLATQLLSRLWKEWI